jgi:hypothetical protein
MKEQRVYGLMAEFEDTDQLLKAAESAYAEGYRCMDAYTPFPVEGLAEAIGFHKTYVPLVCLIGGLTGCIGGFFLQWWPNVIGYPLNIGGKPFNSWPSFIPITFEMTVLFAGLSTVFGMLALNGLPTPYHPVFNAPRFELASRNRFFLCIMAEDAKFDAQMTLEFLQSLNAQEVSEVEG